MSLEKKQSKPTTTQHYLFLICILAGTIKRMKEIVNLNLFYKLEQTINESGAVLVFYLVSRMKCSLNFKIK